jgi:5-methylcytosine-specific restriction endonuclease McrA
VRNLEKEKAASREYRRKHPEKVREMTARRRALKKATQREPIDYNIIIARDGYICHICGSLVAPEELQFDHIIPLSRGGTHTYENIAVAHATCNHKKGARIVVSASPPRIKRRRR